MSAYLLTTPRPTVPVAPDWTEEDYLTFLRGKSAVAQKDGIEVALTEINPLLKDHQKASVQWALRGGCRAIFAAFGLGKSSIQIEIVRLIQQRFCEPVCIVVPLEARIELMRDGRLDTPEWRQRAEELGLDHAKVVAAFGVEFAFIRTDEEMDAGLARGQQFYLTNYESIREGKLSPKRFICISLDEAAVLRSFGSKTFGELVFGAMQSVRFRFVATATPSPNEFLELIAYAAFLGIMDMGESKTRFFKRNSEKAKQLTLLPHKEEEFWLWVASWALVIQTPSDLGPQYSDAGYDLPEMIVRWHEVAAGPAENTPASLNKRGQARLFQDAMYGVSDAARERRLSLETRVQKMQEIVLADRESHFLLWHDLEDERRAIEKALPEALSIYGNMDLEERALRSDQFARGKFRWFATKPELSGSGCNYQRHCRRAIFLGVGYKFNDFIQAIHRIYRFLQSGVVEIDIIYAESERSVRKALEEKWERDKQMRERMRAIIREYGLSDLSTAAEIRRAMGVSCSDVRGERFHCIHNDAVLELRGMEADSIGMILTSIPFSTQYEYSPNYADFGHSDSEDHFFAQMDFLTPHLLRVLKPGRMAAIHVKDRIVPGGKTGLGFQTVYPFHCEVIRHYMKHGFAYMGMKTIVTDVVRENNQTYRLGWTEQCKDGTKMGVGMPEHLLLFRKPPTETCNSYADEPVVKSKAEYTRARWQIDADGFARSDGNRLPAPQDLAQLPWKQVFRLFRAWNRGKVYSYEAHVAIAEALESRNALPKDFALIPCQSWHPDVWTDVTRMRTYNGAQSAKGKALHLCPLQFDICDRAITQYSMPGESVLDPFAGLMTVPARAVRLGRQGIGIELNANYFQDGVAYCRAAEEGLTLPSLFDLMDMEE